MENKSMNSNEKKETSLSELSSSDLIVSLNNYVATVEINRPPLNFFDHDLIARMVNIFDALSQDKKCRAIVLAAKGKAFCAGADFSANKGKIDTDSIMLLYQEAIKLFSFKKPVVAAIEGAAIGGGLGLALVADFRVSCSEARFSANFSRLGIHPGFGLTTTLPELIGENQAALLFYTGRRISGVEALDIGLINVLVKKEFVLAKAQELAMEIASSAPIAIQDMKHTLRGDIKERIRSAIKIEQSHQAFHMTTKDFQIGIKAAAKREEPVFIEE